MHPTLRLNEGVTWEGPGNVRVGNAESATKTPEKVIPAGGLSINCGGRFWMRGQEKHFLVKKKEWDCSSWMRHQG